MKTSFALYLKVFNHGCHRSENGYGKSSSRSGKCQGISLQIKGKTNSLKEVRESEILMVHIKIFYLPLHIHCFLKFKIVVHFISCCLGAIFFIKIELQADVGFQKNLSFLPRYAMKLSISCILHVTC